MIMPEYNFLWDNRPGENIDHIALHDMTPNLWEDVFRRQIRSATDKDDDSIIVAEGRSQQKLYRIVYEIHDDTGFPISRKGLP